jgi:hypothetical protein
MIGFAMSTRGHIHDKTIPVTIQSWGALDFYREVLKKDPADVATLFELWAVTRERGTYIHWIARRPYQLLLKATRALRRFWACSNTARI